MSSMKIMCMVVFMGMLSLHLKAQETTVKNNWTVVVPYRVDITCNKTSNLIFPYDVISVDRGTPAVLVQKAKYVQNILQLKAAAKNADTTNLTVVTADGKFYSFLVAYNDHPSFLNLVLQTDTTGAMAVLPTSENDAILQQGIALVQGAKPFMHTTVRMQEVEMQLRGIYSYQDICYFKIDVKNQSAFTFQPATVALIVKDKHKVKRSASQEKQVSTLLNNPMPVIDGNSTGSFILPVKVFIIAPKQRLIIRLVEKENGRLVQLHVNANRLLKIRSIK